MSSDPQCQIEGFVFPFAGGFDFLQSAPHEAAGFGAVIDADAGFQGDDFPCEEDSGVACGDVTFGPAEEFGTAGEIFEGEDAEGFSGFGDFVFDVADHPGEGKASAAVADVEFVDEAQADEAVGVNDASEFVERVAGDVEAEEFFFMFEPFVLGPFLDRWEVLATGG